MKSIEMLAKTLVDEFQVMQSNNGTRVCLKSTESDLYHFVRDDLHDGYLPDDFKYSVAFDAVNAIAEGGRDEYALGIEPDIYSNDLLIWASSDLNRLEYLDEALTSAIDSGSHSNFTQLIQQAQAVEIEEITSAVLGFVEEQAELEAEEEDDHEL